MLENEPTEPWLDIRRAELLIERLPTHCGDDTCPSCVIAGDYIFLAHHAGGFDSSDVAVQMEASFLRMGETLASAGASLADMVQINLYLKTLDDFAAAREVFFKFFPNGFPARMSSVTAFLDEACLCMIDGVAYKPLS
jgi:2-iminobutanoate/2-iminopropanoate deaminase